MAKVRQIPQSPPTEIDRFLGLNEDLTGSTQLRLGESPNMINYRITENYKLKTREGYEQLFDSIGQFNIQGMWYGKINGTYHFLFASNGKVYKTENGVNTELGTLTDAETFFFSMDDKVYMLNGYEYKSWDGTTFQDVEGHVPHVVLASPPSGGGTPYEQINLLTGKKKQCFSGNGTEKVFQLVETNVDSIDIVWLDGEELTTGFTKDPVLGQVAFDTAPPEGTSNVDIQWTKVTAGDREQVIKCRASMLYGGANDSRIHIWGNSEFKNRRITSGIPVNGSTSAEYFPVNLNADIGSYEHAITDIVKQYDRQIIFTEKGAYYSTYDPFTNELGILESSFPVYPLNDSIGNIPFNQARIVRNNPLSIFSGVREWVSTSVRDERNENLISKRVQPSLDEVDSTQAITIDYEEKGEYWLCVGSTVWVYNYRNDTWYKFELTDTPTTFLVVDGELHFGTTNGQIMKFSEDKRNDNGVAFNREWEMSFYDFGAEWVRKFINRLWIALKPEDKSTVKIKYQTDKSGYSDTFTATYNLATFTNANFGSWSFNLNYNPQPFRFKLKAKKFSYFKVILWNDSTDEIETILSINLLARMGGEVK